MQLIDYTTTSTNSNYSIWEQLPAPEARYTEYYTRHFYQNTAKHLIKDTVRIMMNGLPIDLDTVQELEVVLVEQLARVDEVLAANILVSAYLRKRHGKQIDAYKEDRASKLRGSDYYLKPFKHSDMAHRSFFMKVYSQEHDLPVVEEELFEGIPKWTAARVKKLSETRPILKRLLAGELSDTNPFVQKAMLLLAETKAALHNKSYFAQIQNPEIEFPKFNPGSPQQKAELFGMLGIESNSTTDTGAPQWNRDEIERVNKETDDPDVKELTQALIDHSFAAIVQNNFIKAFYNYTVDGKLYGTLRLFGAKSFRLTSQNPNMLNTPSTGSVFAKPIKKCFVAPEGFLVAAIDYASLEDRVLTSLLRDPGKLAIYEHGLDGHSYNAVQYWPNVCKSFMDITDDPVENAKLFYEEVNNGNKEAKKLRQDSKPITFKCAYLGMPDADKGGVITQELYDNYHNRAYPNIMKNVNEYILPTTKANGQIHLGLGCYLKSDNPDKDFRTLNNALNQFWSILTLTTINELHKEIDLAGLQEDIIVTSTIYDSIYMIVKNDSATIKWLNDTLIPIMEKDFINAQLVKNEADLELGTNWADLQVLKHNATEQEIQEVINSLESH